MHVCACEQELLQVERQVVGWFELKGGRSSDFGPDKFPVFLLQDETGCAAAAACAAVRAALAVLLHAACLRHESACLCLWTPCKSSSLLCPAPYADITMASPPMSMASRLASTTT